MTCTNPRQVWRLRKEFTVGKEKDVILFVPQYGPNWEHLQFKCGECLSCQRAYAGAWATRLWCESMVNKLACCITLTYNDDNLPRYGNLDLDHMSQFVTLLRQYFRRKALPLSIKYFGGAEYGGEKGRPHYHLIIYGFFPSDAYKWRKKGMVQYYRSTILENIWKKGNVEFSEVTPAACSYVANYCLKKVKGKKGKEFYRANGIMDLETGEWIDKVPENCRMSKGIGEGFYQEYKSQIYPADFIVVSGRKRPVPRYFDKLLEEEDPDLYVKVKEVRIERAKSRGFYTDYDLKAIDANVKAQVNMFCKRTMEC